MDESTETAHTDAAPGQEIGAIIYRDLPLRGMRGAVLERDAINEEKRTVLVSFSSETPYERYWGVEILGHQAGEVDLSWLSSGRAPLLVGHDTRGQIGSVSKAYVRDGKGYAVLRFSKSRAADEAFQDVIDGHRSNISVGYEIAELQQIDDSDGQKTFRATSWKPLEISLVSIPADMTVGVGREHEGVLTMTVRQTPPAPPAATTPAPIPAQSADDAVAAERMRVSAISDLARRHNMRDLGERAIQTGASIDQFQGIVLETIGPARPLASSPALIGLTAREQSSFSICRYISGVVARAQGMRPQVDDAFEQQAVAAATEGARKAGATVRGGVLPYDVLMAPPPPMTLYDAQRGLAEFRTMQQRDLIAGSAAAGGNLVATNLLSSSFIELLRNAQMVATMGATVLPGLVGNVAVPKQTGAATAAWIAENAAPAESQQQVGQVVLSPRTVSAFNDFSRLLMLQSSPAIEQLVRADLASVLGLAVDLAALHGTGGLQPLGIAGTSGIGSVAGGTNGAAPTWDNVVDLESAVANANAALGMLGYLTNTKVRGKLKKTQKFSGTNGQSIWDSDGASPDQLGRMNGNRAGVSNQVSSTLTKGSSSGVCSAIFYANWAELMIGEWGILDLLVDPYSQSSAGIVRVVGFKTTDVAMRHVESFAAMLDALTT